MKEVFDKLNEISISIAVIQENTKHMTKDIDTNTKNINQAVTFIAWLKGLGAVTIISGLAVTYNKLY